MLLGFQLSEHLKAKHPVGEEKWYGRFKPSCEGPSHPFYLAVLEARGSFGIDFLEVL